MPAQDAAPNDGRERLLAALAETPRGDGGIIIAGGGIGGLATALALARRGIASHVLERRAAFSEQGAGIQIGPNGTRILRDLGVAEALRPHAGVPRCLIVHDARSGRELTRMPLNPEMEQRFGAPYWVLHREDLHAALVMQVRAEPKISVSLDVAVDDVAANDAAAGVVARDGRCFTGSAVVGADGLRSRLRSLISGGDELVPAGKSAYRAVVPAADVDAALREAGTRIWLAPNAHVVHYTVRGGSEVAIVLIVDDAFAGEGWSHEADPSAAIGRLALAPQLREVLGAAKSWRKWGLVRLAAAPVMARGRLTLLGDAAHPVLPFLAQGGVLALEDAAVLADVLASGEHDVAGALQIFAQRRRARAQRVAAASQRNGQIYHLSGAAAAARNAAMRAVPGKRLIAGYDWIYGWTRDAG